MKKNTNITLSILLLSVLVGCSSENFRKKIDNEEFDSIKDESFSRFNSARIDNFEKKSMNDVTKAIAACHAEKFYKGKTALEDKMQQEKNNPYYWSALGTCYYLQDEISKALFYFDLASESIKTYKGADKNFLEANIENNIGLIHLKNKRYNEAFDSFKKASALASNVFTPKINMAQIYLEFNQNERAIDVLSTIESKSRDVDVLYSLSLAYFRVGNFDKSFATIIKIDRSFLNRADIVGLYALNLMRKNRLVDAKQILEKRIVASEFEDRNKMILDKINDSIKDVDNKKTN